MKSTVINQPFKLASRSANIDSIYGPYKSIKEALDNVPLEYRAIGRTLAILEDGSLSEYQFKKGIRDEDLELKNSIDSGDIGITWDDISGKPTVIASGGTAQEARNKIGAGTSNLTIGTTASTAKAGNYQPTTDNISDATDLGKKLMKAPDAASARTAIGAGTSNLAIGTTGTTAAAGNHTHTQYAPTTHEHVISDITDVSDIGKSLMTVSSASAARTAIGAGTGNSNLQLGTTATTAKAGNYQPTWADITDKPATFAPTIGNTNTTAKAGNYKPTIAEITEAFANIDETQREAIKIALGLNV